MVKTVLTACRGNSAATGVTTTSATQYTWFGNATIVYNNTEANREITWRTAGTFSKLYVRVLGNSCSASSTVKVRKNRADPASGLTLTITAGFVGVVTDLSNSVTVAAGDEMDYQVITGAGGTLTIALISCIFDATTNTVTKHVIQGYSLTGSGTTHYTAISGNRSANTALETDVQHNVTIPGTAKNMSLLITGTNTRTTDTIFTLRKNGVDTALTITVPAGDNGIFEDSTHTVSFAANDKINWTQVTGVGTSQSCQFQHIAFDFETGIRAGLVSAGCIGSASDIILSPGATHYFVIGGSMVDDATTEADAEQTARENMKLKGLTIYARANSIAADSTVTLRKNGGDATQTVSIPANTPGYYIDTTNVDSYTTTDTMCVEIEVGAGGTALTIEQIAVYTDLSTDVTKAPSAETVSITEDLDLVQTKARTASETITIGETATRLGTKTRPLSQTVSITEDLDLLVTPIGGGANIEKGLTETITIGAGTLARMKAAWRQQP